MSETLNWEEAEAYLETVEEEYAIASAESLAQFGYDPCAFVTPMIKSVRHAFDNGDRTEVLYKTIMGISL